MNQSNTIKENKIKFGPAKRDSKGRPFYLSTLPFWRRYPRLCIVGGGALVALLPFSGQIYDIFTKHTPEDIPKYGDWWPSERARGMKNVDYIRERRKLEAEAREQAKAAREQANAAREQAKAAKAQA